MTLERLRVKYNNTKMETSTSEVLLPCTCQHSWASPKPTPPQALLAPQLPCTYQHPSCASCRLCLPRPGGDYPDLRAANTPHMPTRHSQALEPALPGHQGHMLGHQYQPCFSSLISWPPQTWALVHPPNGQENTNFCVTPYAQAVSPHLECSHSQLCRFLASWNPPELPPLASLPPRCPLPTQAEPQS